MRYGDLVDARRLIDAEARAEQAEAKVQTLLKRIEVLGKSNVELDAEVEMMWRFMEEDEDDYNHSGRPIRQLYREWKSQNGGGEDDLRH